MARRRFSSIPHDLPQAIERLPNDHSAGRRTRALARLLDAGMRPREIVEVDLGGAFRLSEASLVSAQTSSGRAGGRQAWVVPLDAAAAADVAAFLEDRQTGRRDIRLSHVEAAVKAVSEQTGTKLRFHDFRTAAATRLAEAKAAEDRRCRGEGQDPDGSL